MISVDWNERYKTGDTPWEKGGHHPGLPFLLETHLDLVERATSVLVPGCGLGYDIDLIGELTSSKIVGLDIAEEPIRRAKERVNWNRSLSRCRLFQVSGIMENLKR